MQRRVLSITSYKIFPAQSGGQKAIVYFYKYLSKETDFLCVGVKNNDSSNTYGIQYLDVFSTSPLRYINLFYYFRLKRIIKQNKIDTIIIEHPYMGILGVLLQRFQKVKLVVRSHNIEGLRFKDLGKWWWKILLQYETLIHRTADFSFFITEEDSQYAIRHFGLQQHRAAVITYGTEVSHPYSLEAKKQSVQLVKKQYQIPLNHLLLLFNGVFGYRPNDEALHLLVQKIMPQLLSQNKNFTLLVCGKNIPESINVYQSENIIIKGFVDDIEAIFKGTDIFLNPIWLGGGIKTKLVEALACGASVVSFNSGAVGIPKNSIRDKLITVEDRDTTQFVQTILQKAFVQAQTPQSFYDYFYWGNIANKAIQIINSL